jgi:hypothetical protein
MENTEITNHSELIIQIALVKSEKTRQEEALKYIIKEFSISLNPLSIIKNSIHELAADKVVKLDLAKVGLNMGANFLIEKLLGRNSSIKGFLSSLLVEKVSGGLISNNMPKILSVINNLFNWNVEERNSL